MDTMVKVDIELFIKCRLCVENNGMYQITPLLQEQIKYCFDIDVTSYDGLPQLICNDCKIIVGDYQTKKRTFVGKQNALKLRLQLRKEMEMSRSQQAIGQNEVEEELPYLRTRPSVASERRTSAASEISSDSSHSFLPKKTSPASSKKHEKRQPEPWAASYNKAYVCRLCHKHCKTRGSINLHFRSHKSLFNRNPEFFMSHCKVELEKFDSKPNVTGSETAVVFDPDRIVRDEGKMHYYVLFYLKDEFKHENNAGLASDKESDSSDDFAPKMRAKRRRVALSSTETVVLDDRKSLKSEEPKPIESDKNEAVAMECIDLGDTSDSSTNEAPTSTSKENLKTNSDNTAPTAKSDDHKSVANIVSACLKKHLKKIETLAEQEKKSDSNKNKLLNIGLKSIFKSDFRSNGLLRYLANDHLEINWIPTYNAAPTNSKENKCVRIMPRMKNKQDLDQDEVQWRKVVDNERSLLAPNIIPHKKSETRIEKCDTVSKTAISDSSSTVRAVPIISTTNGHSTPEVFQLKDGAILYCNASAENDKKLLNANPVPNPKQLPKKAVSTTLSKDPVPPKNETNLLEDNTIECNEDDICMPIITSTTSLAQPKNTSEPDVLTNDDNTKSNDSTESTENPNQTSMPRIKVKNVADLMSDKALSQHNAPPQTNLWYMPMQNAFQNVSSSVNNDVSTSGQTMPYGQPRTDGPREYLIMHTDLMPNTRTASPFQYLQNLLRAYNIVLWNSSFKITEQFSCLIKFKLQFTQNNSDPSVLLMLSLHCFNNQFFMGVRDPAHPENIDLNKLSAIWQWKIIKTYAVEEGASNKLLQNAEKVGPPVPDFVKSFIHLLKSIQVKNELE